MARSKGEGSMYYIEKRKKWSAQYTITVGEKQVRKTVYGNTKREVADKLLDLRVQMKDIDLIKEHGMSIIQIMKDIRDKKFNSNRIYASAAPADMTASKQRTLCKGFFPSFKYSQKDNNPFS